MARHKIWEKDDFFLIGGERIDMNPDVVKIPEDRVVLTWGFSFDNDEYILGWAHDIKLEGEEITCLLDLNDKALGLDELLDKKDVRLGGFYNRIEKHTDAKGGVHCIDATLRSVGAFSINPANPRVVP